MNHTENNNSQIENFVSPLENRVNDALDSSIDDLHPDVRRKLNQARIKALQSRASMPFFKKPVWKIAGTISFVMTLSIVFMSDNQQLGEIDKSIAENSVVEKSIIFSDSLTNDEILLLENLEFALWMTEEDEIASL